MPPAARVIKRVSIFDTIALDRLVADGYFNEKQKDKVLSIAATVPPEKAAGPCNHAYWKALFPHLNKKATTALEENNFVHYTSSVVLLEHTSNGDTSKFVTELEDGHKVETCIMRKGKTKGDQKKGVQHQSSLRSTVCVSCQIGCSMACTFCATGTMGLQGNLTAGEIYEQIVHAMHIENEFRRVTFPRGGSPRHFDPPARGWIRNVVYMGMGEPLANYLNVVSSAKALINQRVMGLAPHHVTISTVGFSPSNILRLIEDVPDVSLALSLHAPNQKLRNQIVPVSNEVDLSEMLDACMQFVENQRYKSHSKAKRQCLLIEYCLLGGVNDQVQHAHELSKLLAPYKDMVMVNLIPYNPTDVTRSYSVPEAEDVTRFHRILHVDCGIPCFLRQQHGQEVEGACGQLAIKTLKPPKEAEATTTRAVTDEAERSLTPDRAFPRTWNWLRDDSVRKYLYICSIVVGAVGAAAAVAVYNQRRPRRQGKQ